jgi:hypothetical protein
MSHAYSLIGAYVIKDHTGKITNKLYQIRNPWGKDKGYYSGAWNDGDTKHWTPLAKA